MRLIDADELIKRYSGSDRSYTNEPTIRATIERQPTVNQWIPCNRNLPSSNGKFEVTIKGSKGKRYVEMLNFDKNTNKWGFDKYWYPNVIAWRGRPEPYKEGE